MSDVTPPIMSNSFFGSQPSSISEDELITMSTLRKILNQEIRVVMKKELEVMVLPIINRVLVPMVEDLTRRIIKEQIELAVKKFFDGALSNRENEQHASQPRRLTLQFRNGLSLPIWTGNEIRGKENDFLEVALIDDLSGEIVKSGPEAYAKVKIVALEGNKAEEESRTSEEVNNNISGKKKDKNSLLSGDVDLTLNNGVGVLENIKFTHASKWLKQNKYKLSARAVGAFDGVHIREAKTESFLVTDRRNNLYTNSEIPNLSDSVYKLKNISRKNKIWKDYETVEKFLCALFKDPDRLKQLAGMKPQTWEVTVAHARTCTIDKRMSCYADSQRKMVVVFNLVEQVLGVVSGGHYFPREKLSDDEKAAAHKLAIDALDNLNHVVCFNDEDSVICHFSSLFASVDATSSQELEHPRGENIIKAPQMIGECSHNQLYVANEAILQSMNSAEDTPSQMHSVPNSVNPFSLMDKQLHVEDANFYQALENVSRTEQSDKEKAGVLEVPIHALDNRREMLFSDDEASLRKNLSSSYPSIASTSSREMEHPKGKSTEASEMISEYNPLYASCDNSSLINLAGSTSSYNQLYAANEVIFQSINSVEDTPSQILCVPNSINPFSLMGKQLHMEDANFYQAPEDVLRMEQSDKEKAGVLEVPIHALDNRRDMVFSDDEASLRGNFSSLYPSIASTRSREMDHPKGKSTEASEMISKYNPLYASCDILSLINPAEGTSSATHPVPQSTNARDVMDEQFYMEIAREAESSDGGFVYDDDNFRLHSSPSLYAPADLTSSQGLECPRRQHPEASRMIDERSYSNYNASSHDNTRSTNSDGVLPQEVQPGLHCINDFNLMDDQQLTEHATTSKSPETMTSGRYADEQNAAAHMMFGTRPSKAWGMLINVLRLRRYLLLQCPFAVWKKRRVQ